MIEKNLLDVCGIKKGRLELEKPDDENLNSEQSRRDWERFVIDINFLPQDLAPSSPSSLWGPKETWDKEGQNLGGLGAALAAGAGCGLTSEPHHSVRGGLL